jgi:hypothetical protein
VAAGYLIAWAARKAKRVGGRLDAETDDVIDASLDRLHEVVAARLGGHPVLAEMVQEAEATGQVEDLTRQQLELALTAAAGKDELFARAVSELVAQLDQANPAASPGLTVFTGSAHAEARDGGIAIGQAGQVHFASETPGPPQPGRSGH